MNDDGSPLTEDLSGGFARGHYEQHVGAKGAIRGRRRGVGDRRLRPARPLVGPALLAGALVLPLAHDELRRRRRLRGLGHHRADGSERVGGVAFEDGKYHHLDHATIDTDWIGDDKYHEEMRITAKSGDRTYEITGSVLNLIPLRNRRKTPEGEQLVTRISEGMTEWKWDGRSGYGLSEYLDQIVDGAPVGARLTRADCHRRCRRLRTERTRRCTASTSSL